MNDPIIESVIEKLRALRMKTAAEHLVQILQRAETQNLPPLMIIEALVDIEGEMRQKNRILRRFKQSRLLEKPTIDQFDFHFHISPTKTEDQNPRPDGYDLYIPEKRCPVHREYRRGEKLPGKVHRLCRHPARRQNPFTTAIDMINLLTAADVDRSLLKKLYDYQTPDLLVIDEIGYLPLGAQGSNLFFQVISARHQKKSTVITTNLIFAEWGTIFDNTTVATAIADRLVHNSEVIVMEGPSYRTKNKS